MRNVRTVPALELPAALSQVEEVTGVFPHLQTQHFKVLPNEKPKILIGQAHIHVTVAREIIENGDDAPVLTKTKLGWVLHGPITGKEATHSSFCCHHETDDDLLTRLLKESYNIDVGVGIKKPARSRDDQFAEEKMMKITSRVGDRWQTGLLWRSEDTKLPPSYDAAFRRLMGVERRFRRDPELKRAYEEKINAYIEKGYARVLSPEEAAIPSDVEWYLPHFATTHPNKPGKIRIVLDAASRSKGVCLNDKLLTGPDLLVSLHGLLLKFRRKKVGFMGDIAEMFHQVRIRRDDCPAQRILWRTDTSQPPNIIQVEVMIFGSVCSPYSAQYVKNLNASEFSIQYPAASHAILMKHYMDDYLDCCDDEKEAVQLAKDVATVHSKGGFEIGKWSSNSSTFLRQLGVVPSQEVHDLSKWSEIQTERVLGLHWSPEADAFTFRVNLERAGAGIATGEKIPTKREILRLVMLLWDPLGFFAHFTIKAKILLQHLWRKKLGWDDELPVNMLQSWRKWVRLLPKMREFVLPRMYSPSLQSSPNTQLHIFADSSETAYCSIGFLRISHDDGESYDVSFIFAKCRVAPLKPCSIPRLELQAALLASRIGKFATEELEIPIHKTYYWTDSMTTLRRIRSDARRFTQFVANRVGEIQENSSVDDWKWVPTKENPADLGTREGSTDLSMASSWWTGPKFLYLASSEWPREPSRWVEEETELKRDFIAVVVAVPECSLPDCTRFSNYMRLVRATAYMLKFIDIVRKQPSSNGSLPIKRAEQLLFRRCQWESYPNEMKMLESMKTLPPSSPLFELSPFLDHNGVLRMKSRLATVQDEGVRLPIILHPKSYLTKLVIQYYHKLMQHQGEDMIRNEMRQLYWIPRLRIAVRNVIRSCGECRLRKIKHVQPRMGDLPDFRVQPQPRPFTITGMDYFGPMEVTHGRKHEKRYGVLFTCLSTRAVHLEVAHSLTTDSCIMAIRRFIGRRGQPKEIHSDNGTNLRGADKELRLALTELDQGEIEDDLSVRGIQWHFLPPAAPNMAGAWERLVRSVKTALSVILKSRFPKDEVLRTVFAEAEAIVNARPLVDVPVDPESPEALTPFHFLVGASSASQPPGDFLEKEADLGKLWRQTQAMADMFWRRWIREYLSTLQRRAKWHGFTPNVEVGDVVVVLDESLRRSMWPLGKVLNVFPGKDGVVRVVEVQTVTGIYRRPVTKLGKLDVKASAETGGIS